MERKIALWAKDITIAFKDKIILENINLKIYEHETVVFIGPSGGGKTVLLKTLAGIYPPSSGQVFIQGEDWQQLESEEKHHLARKLGMLFQQGALFDTMTTLENVEFPIREHYHLSEEEIHEHAKELLRMVNLGDAFNLKPSELSGGMQRRLGIARALALNPEVLFYDDPVAGQDPIQSDQVSTLMMNFREKNNSTLVVTTSSMRLAYKVADRIFMVVDKQIIEAGSPEQTKKNSDPRIQQFINGNLTGPIKSF